MQPDDMRTRRSSGGQENVHFDSQDAAKKPQIVPKDRKDYKAFEAEKRRKETSEGEDGEEGEVTEKKPGSIFDLVRKAPVKDQDKGEGRAFSEEKAEIPNLGDEKLSKKEEGKDTKEFDPISEKEEDPFLRASKKAKEESKQDLFAREQPDLASVNPLAAQEGGEIQTAFIQKESIAPPKPVSELIDQLVDKITMAKTEGITETTITLKHPPLFSGAEIKLTSYETARGEFNLSFHNLSSQGKNVIDMNLNALRQGLEQKGHVLHIVTTSTQTIEAPKEAEGEYTGREGRGEKEGGGEEKEEKDNK